MNNKILRAAEALKRAGSITDAAANLGLPRETVRNHLMIGVRDGILNSDYTVSATPQNSGEVVLAIPDLHCPFHHQDSLDFLLAVQEKYGTTEVVCLGDEADQYALSQYPSDPEAMSAGDEHEATLNALKPFFEAFPDVRVCVSNHTDRVYRKAFSTGIPRFMLKEYAELFNAPTGWTWNETWEIDGVLYIHGTNYGGIHANYNAAQKLMKPVVHGHVHVGGGVYVVNHNEGVVGLNAGCLMDANSYAAAYARNSPVPLTLGCGVIECGRQFHFVRMVTDSNNRWIGEL